MQATGPGGAVVTYSASATDIVDGSVPVDCTPASGSTFPLGAHDGRLHAPRTATTTRRPPASTCSSRTRGAPVLTVPADFTVEADEPGGANVTYTASATDDVDGPVPVTCTPPSGSFFPIRVNVVTCTATDSDGNTSTETFRIRVRTRRRRR